MAEQPKVRPSQFASAVLTLRGRRLSFDGYKPFETIYDVSPPMLVLKAGRQVGKSVSLAGSLTTRSILIPHFNSLYVAPISTQTSRFSTSYLDPYLNAPLIKKHFRDGESKKNVFEKSLNNGSRLFLGYAATEGDADRIRGVNADQNMIDEAQDIAQEALPIIFETLSSSQYSYKAITGTAKTMNNTLQNYFDKGNGLEWCSKCEHCGLWIIPNELEICVKILAGKEGPICPYCGKPHDLPSRGGWVATRPHIKDIFSFHLPQLIFGSRTTPRKWAELKGKLTDYTPSKLANEVFGLASGMGGRILSFKEAIACCDNNRQGFDNCWPMDTRGINQVVVGVDWSVTGGHKSYTVVTVLGSDFAGKVFVLYAERLNGSDILDQVRRVEQIYRQFNAQLIASDRGVGVLQVQLLQESLGPDRVYPINYVAAQQPLVWNSKGQFFAADRTMAIDSMVLKMKLGPDRFSTPSWGVMSSFWEDALSMFEEETRAGRKVYRKDEDKPDDWMHSVTFANVGLQILRGEYKTVESISEQ